MHSLVQLHAKLEFIASEPKARAPARTRAALCTHRRSSPRGAQAKQAAALQDVEPELERLRVKAAGKVRGVRCVTWCAACSTVTVWPCAQVREFLLQRFCGLRKPKTNIQVRLLHRQHRRRVRATAADGAACRHTRSQILQQNVLLKFKYFVKFLQQHCPEVFPEVRQAYVETLSRIYRSALCASATRSGCDAAWALLTTAPPACRAAKYVIALNQLQVDMAGRLDLLGAPAWLAASRVDPSDAGVLRQLVSPLARRGGKPLPAAQAGRLVALPQLRVLAGRCEPRWLGGASPLLSFACSRRPLRCDARPGRHAAADCAPGAARRLPRDVCCTRAAADARAPRLRRRRRRARSTRTRRCSAARTSCSWTAPPPSTCSATTFGRAT